MPPSKRAEKYDGRRGENGTYGCWLTLKEAREVVAGREKWWKSEAVPNLRSIQHASDGPLDKPVWMFENGDMYLGEWKVDGPNGWPVEHGVGITHYFFPRKYKGMVYAGEWKNGRCHGMGEMYWLKSTKVWQMDHLPGSPLSRRNPETKNKRGVPFHYKGNWKTNFIIDENAIVTLKDGTCRVGPWDNGEPVGDWSQHKLLANPRALSAVVPETSNLGIREQEQKKHQSLHSFATTAPITLGSQKSSPPVAAAAKPQADKSPAPTLVQPSPKKKRLDPEEEKRRIRKMALTPSRRHVRPSEGQKKRKRSDSDADRDYCTLTNDYLRAVRVERASPSTGDHGTKRKEEQRKVRAKTIKSPTPAVVDDNSTKAKKVRTQPSEEQRKKSLSIRQQSVKAPSHKANQQRTSDKLEQNGRRSSISRPQPTIQRRAVAAAPARDVIDLNHIFDSDSDDETSQTQETPQPQVTIKQDDTADAQTNVAIDPATEKQNRIQRMADYITHEVIGNNPNPITMAEYAEQFYSKGFQSVEMMQAYLKRRHIESYDWLMELHKEIILENLEAKAGTH